MTEVEHTSSVADASAQHDSMAPESSVRQPPPAVAAPRHTPSSSSRGSTAYSRRESASSPRASTPAQAAQDDVFQSTRGTTEHNDTFSATYTHSNEEQEAAAVDSDADPMSLTHTQESLHGRASVDVGVQAAPSAR